MGFKAHKGNPKYGKTIHNYGELFEDIMSYGKNVPDSFESDAKLEEWIKENIDKTGQISGSTFGHMRHTRQWREVVESDEDRKKQHYTEQQGEYTSKSGKRMYIDKKGKWRYAKGQKEGGRYVSKKDLA